MSNGDDNPSRPLLGAHMSTAGGIGQALVRARSAGCDCVQVFTKSSRQWASRPFTSEEVADFARERRETGVTTVLAHDSYLVNLCAPNERLRKLSLKGFIDELERCELLDIPYLVTHPGSHCGEGEEFGIAMIARSIDQAQKSCAGYRTRIALEITAGQGSNLGYNFPQMARIFDSVQDSDRLRLCFDTEHAFAAGYDLRTEDGYQRTFTELDEHIGIERIVGFHLNDSKKPLNSRVDRHEHIGKGHLGLASFKRLLNDRRFAGLPMCLETPKGPELKEDIENLAALRALFE